MVSLKILFIAQIFYIFSYVLETFIILVTLHRHNVSDKMLTQNSVQWAVIDVV